MTPPDPFVPLTATLPPSSQREFQVTILNHQNHSEDNSKSARPSGFQALDGAKSSSHMVANGTEKKIGEPRVSIQRDGNRITHLRIQCGCGQVIDLACVYDPPQPAAS
jgi:hypothetical protein